MGSLLVAVVVVVVAVVLVGCGIPNFFHTSGDLNVFRIVGGFTFKAGLGATLGGVTSRSGDGASGFERGEST